MENEQTLTDDQIMGIAKKIYPEVSKKDFDGDWYDPNEVKRCSFVEGFKFRMTMECIKNKLKENQTS